MKYLSSANLLYTVTITTLFMWGVFLRLYPINSQPYWMDEGFTINATITYQENSLDGLSTILDSGAQYECFLYCQTTALISNTFGESPFTFRILATIFGLISLFSIFKATQLLSSTKIAFFTITLVNLWYLHQAWSTQARWYTMSLTFVWMVLYFYLKTFLTDNKNSPNQRIFKIGLFISIGLAILAHQINIVLIPLLFGHFFLTNQTKIKTAHLINTVVIFIIGSFFIINFTSLLQNLNLNYNLPYYLHFILGEYWFLLPFALFTLIHKPTSENLFLSFFFLSYLIPLSFFTDIVQFRYLFVATPALFILASIGAFYLYEALLEKYQLRQVGKFVFILLFTTLFLLSPSGNIIPQKAYQLESDRLAKTFNSPSQIYTPQPDWNEAYNFIKENRNSSDIIISNQATFTKIFLNETGYWLAHHYVKNDAVSTFRTKDNREYYVGAPVIENLSELKDLVENHHGFIVVDFMVLDNRLDTNIVDFIVTETNLVFHKKSNPYSEIWVYQF